MRFEYTAEGWQRLRIPDKPGGGPNTFRQREWKYFADGMLKEEHVATDGSNSATNTFEYDANNNLVKAHNTTGLNATTKQKPMLVMADYDLLDRPFKVRSQRDQEPNWNVTTMGYDLNGNLTSRTDDRDEDGSGAVVNGKAGRDQRSAMTRRTGCASRSIAVRRRREATTVALRARFIRRDGRKSASSSTRTLPARIP